ncbi:hypothetical protein D9Q98_000492 [Chlorella vulgaris]|uniref:Amidase domain-containing protein n=1 Tax=Chlorella vulgaris TaxID=3077 RepID=A0A9D4TY92_CHLVU|nr:hypothetical protein D9Q98_000492 [Chlorella vulgaris]
MSTDTGAPSSSSEPEQEEQQTVDSDSGIQPEQALPAKVGRSLAAPGSSSSAFVLAAGAAAAATALFFVVRRLQRRFGGDRVHRVVLKKEDVFSVVLALRQPSVPLPPPVAAILAGRTLVLSDRLDVQSLETRFGCEAWKGEQQPAKRTYGPADVLVAAGAHGIAVVYGEPLGLGPLLSISGAGTPNPAGRGHVQGGGEYGAAAAVTGGLADLALTIDELGSARVPAACCGAYALRTSVGVLPLEGATTASASLAAATLLATNPLLILRAGQALRLPGGGAAKADVLQYLVAEDFFAACGEEPKRMMPAVISAVKRWAGPDQAQALSLCEWLHHSVPGLAAFMPPGNGAAAAAGSPEAKQQRAQRMLQALATVAEVVQQREFVQRCGAWVEVHRGRLPAAVADYWQQACLIQHKGYRSALEVAKQLQAAMRDALADGKIFVLPTTPGPAPPLPANPAAPTASEQEALRLFRQRCAQFAAIASLTGGPQVVVPLPVPGAMPLSVSLLAAHKRDLVLAEAAAKIGPMLAEEAATLVADQKANRAQQWQPAANPAPDIAGGSSSKQPTTAAKRGAGKRGAKGSEEAAAAAAEAAEARKEDGNKAYRAGRYDDAVRFYSAALQLSPRSAVYHGNRAMANLKLGEYGAAEADCDQALKLELSAKTLLRRGSARLAQGNGVGARADFKQVLALEPQNRQAREELRRLEVQERSGGLEGPTPLAMF